MKNEVEQNLLWNERVLMMRAPLRLTPPLSLKQILKRKHTWRWTYGAGAIEAEIQPDTQ